MAKLAYLETFDTADIEKLEAAGLRTSDDLLARAATAEMRAALAARSGVAEATVLRLARMADILRVKGVVEMYIVLFEALGIASAAALGAQDAAVLIKQMRRKNVELLAARGLPPESMLARWIADARALPTIARF